jgi:hypothetical protein
MARTSDAERRDQLIKCAVAVAKLAEHREIEPISARLVKHDVEVRHVLGAIIMRWEALKPTRYTSPAAAKPGSKVHREHVVPVRVLVDRMIMNPGECRALLEKAVIIASVTPEEHGKLGPLIRQRDLYARMHSAHVSRLGQRGLDRYRTKGITLKRTS